MLSCRSDTCIVNVYHLFAVQQGLQQRNREDLPQNDVLLAVDTAILRPDPLSDESEIKLEKLV